jgi:DNA-binding response OmpR family regulator
MRPRLAYIADSEAVSEGWLPDLRLEYDVGEYVWRQASPVELAKWAPNIALVDLRSTPELPESPFRMLRMALAVPILVLAPAHGDEFVVRALHLGADGCLPEPISGAELLARVEAHHRRYWDWQGQNAAFREAGLLIDAEACSVLIEDRTVKLTPTECRLLARLAQKEGEVVQREDLSSHLWGLDGADDNSGLVSLYIHYLRQKIEKDPHFPRYIRTKRGGGYYLSRDRA